MSDDGVKPGPDYPAVSFADAVEYLQDKTKDFVCEACQTESWTVLSRAPDTVPALIIQSTLDFNTISTLPIVLLTCNNCGNTKMFLERAIYRYINNKRSLASVLGDKSGD